MNKSNFDSLASIGFGLVSGARRVNSLGNNPDIDVAPEDIWPGGGLYPWMSAATSLEILSASANDAAAGTGARTVFIQGLDANYAEVSFTVTLNGVTPVAFPSQLLRIQSMSVTSSGSGGVNAGDLTIRDAGGGTTRGFIQAGYGASRKSQYTVPAGYTLQILSALIGINRPSAARDATVAFVVRQSDGTYNMPLEVSSSNSAFTYDTLPGISVPERTDFGMRCTYVSATNTDITAAWSGIMVKNTDLQFLA